MSYQCACGFQCSIAEDFRKHLLNKHHYSDNKIFDIMNAKKESITCGICQKICVSERHYFMHLINEHQHDPLSAFDDVALVVQDNL